MKGSCRKWVRAALLAVSSAAFLSLQCPAVSMTASAHSGRTDAGGGHHDYKNRSGLGSYHYHHGYSAHLHPDGICPYEHAQNTAPAAGSTAVNPVSPAVEAVPENSENGAAYVVSGIDYAHVFDPAFYAAANPDIAALYGTDASLLFQHFLTSGMAEGRRGNEEFQVQVYKAANPQIAALFGENLPQYYLYYCLISS